MIVDYGLEKITNLVNKIYKKDNKNLHLLTIILVNVYL